jgi:hypothetical protein
MTAPFTRVQPALAFAAARRYEDVPLAALAASRLRSVLVEVVIPVGSAAERLVLALTAPAEREMLA